MNELYYGDNLAVLREHVADASVDLIYLDPPFNSNASYNVLFKGASGDDSAAQIEAFDDTWQWSDMVSGRAMAEVQDSGYEAAGDMLTAMVGFLGKNAMTAYLAMMAVRLVELHRVLKPTGSLYLHCDPTASHYLKILLDAVFGAKNFQAEIIWKRTNARGTKGKWPWVHDTIIHIAKSDAYRHSPTTTDADIKKLPHTLITGADGKKYQTFELTGAGTRQGETGKPWRDFDPNSFGRHWGNLHAHMDELDAAGLIHWPNKEAFRGGERLNPSILLTVASLSVMSGLISTG